MIAAVHLSLPGPEISSRHLEALTVAINQAATTPSTPAGGKKTWYISAEEVQLVSLQLLSACRTAHGVHLRVDRYTPAHMWAQPPARGTRRAKQRRTGRVPSVRAQAVRWELSAQRLAMGGDGLAAVEYMVFDNDASDLVHNAVWPTKLKTLIFGHMFNSPVDETAWPAHLLELTFGVHFRQPMDDVAWPKSLRKLTFGAAFNRPIDGVKWPASLQELTFGYFFNQPIHEVTWPESLRVLVFGKEFDQSLDGVAWPTSLQRLIIPSQPNFKLHAA